MTGYGKEIVQLNQQTISVEMRSVNHRYLDITMKMPRNLMFMEEKFKRIIKGHFYRGKLEVYINFSGQGNINKHLQVDWELINQYIENINKIKTDHHLAGDIPVSVLASLPEIFEIQEEEKDDNELKKVLLVAIEKACMEMLAMRETEGDFLEKDIILRLEKLEQLTTKLQEIRPRVIQEYQERIMKRINEYVATISTIDESRIEQEVAILAEKGDITEEIIRLGSHIEHMRKTLKEEESIGRKLDFICQEMHREANTIGSKSTDAEINQIDVLLKSEIEKIKEQIQNIE